METKSGAGSFTHNKEWENGTICYVFAEGSWNMRCNLDVWLTAVKSAAGIHENPFTRQFSQQLFTTPGDISKSFEIPKMNMYWKVK